MYKDVIEGFHRSQAQQFTVNATTLDRYMRDNNISKIDLLKIDTVGNELNILKGASDALNGN